MDFAQLKDLALLGMSSIIVGYIRSLAISVRQMSISVTKLNEKMHVAITHIEDHEGRLRELESKKRHKREKLHEK